MKKLLVALLVGAMPALAVGQSVDPTCPEGACHFAPYFQGEGGFVGEPATNDEGEPLLVRLAVICGRVTISGEIEPDADGIVRQVLSSRNGLACGGDGGTFEVRGLRDGGWYWINDRRNSAVSSLFRLGARDNPETTPLDPGGVTIATTRNGAATYVRHEPTGRVGIVPHIQPVAPTRGCSGEASEADACVLGAPEDWEFVLTMGENDAPVGSTPIERGADVSVKVSLVGGHYIRTASVAADVSISGGMRGETVLNTPGQVTVSTTPADPIEGGELAWTILVPNDPARCFDLNADRLVRQTVLVSATGALTGAIPAYAAGEGPSASFTINCPDSG